MFFARAMLICAGRFTIAIIIAFARNNAVKVEEKSRQIDSLNYNFKEITKKFIRLQHDLQQAQRLACFTC